jgi:hypothetical protein
LQRLADETGLAIAVSHFPPGTSKWNKIEHRLTMLFPYFVQACARQLGGYVRAGTPIAEHRRNSHNHMKDAGAEWACIVVLEDLLPWLRETTLPGNSYIETFRSLSHAMEDAVEKMRGSLWTDATRGYFHQMAYHMRLWLKACEEIGGRSAAVQSPPVKQAATI